MDGLYDILVGVFGDSSAMMLALLVFLATAVLTFGVMVAVHARGAVKRRAAGIAEYSGDGQPTSGTRCAARASRRSSALLDYTTKHYGATDKQATTKVLRRRLIQAGIFDARAVAYLLRRAHRAGGRPRGCGILRAADGGHATASSMFWLTVMVGGIVGYVGAEHLSSTGASPRAATSTAPGFPDFMDLLVVCADSGLSMEAALERVGRELGDSYPSLCANIHMANLEIRAGRTMTEALEHLGDRLGLEEARSFATLIQQSAELGSSITDALRVYSRRHAPQAALARRGEGLQPAGEARRCR